MKPDLARRLTDSVETASNLSGGLVILNELDGDKDTLFSQNYACEDCGISMPELSPRMFSLIIDRELFRARAVENNVERLLRQRIDGIAQRKVIFFRQRFHAHLRGAEIRRQSEADRLHGRDRGADRARNSLPAVVFAGGGPELSDAFALCRHAFRRRKPAYPAGHADRLEPHRRSVYPRRAVHRPAPAG